MWNISKTLCAKHERLSDERSESDNSYAAHKVTYTPNNIYYFFVKRLHLKPKET